MNAWHLCGLSRADWVALGLSVRIRLAASLYLGWYYDHADPHVAYESPGIPAGLVRNGRTAYAGIDCSTLTASVLTACYPDAPWTSREYGDLQVFEDRLPANPSAPVTACIRMRIAHMQPDLTLGRWHIVQGWRTLDPRPSGHAFLVQAGPGTALVLESTSWRGIGPRWRYTTPTSLRDAYPAGLYIARLESP